MISSNTTSIKLDNVRCAYLTVFSPRVFSWGGEPMYGIQIIMPKDHPQKDEICAVIRNAALRRFEFTKGISVWPREIRHPLHDGDRERKEPEYEGQLFFYANNRRRPLIVDRRTFMISEQDGLLYSGSYVNVIMTAYSYERNGSRGVSLSLDGVQYVRPGTPLGIARDLQFEDLDASK